MDDWLQEFERMRRTWSDLMRRQMEEAAAIAAATGPSLAIARDLERQREQVNAWLAESASAAAAAARLFQPAIDPALLDFTRELQELPRRTREDLQVLAARGWYLDPNMVATGPSRIRKAIKEGQTQEVDEALVKWYRDQLEKIRSSLTARHPHRATILGKAFDAHARGDFELSVPVLLAQADGICWDHTRKSLFRGKDKAPEVASWVATLAADAYRIALLSPITETHPISLSEKKRPADFDGLNRHQVLHGESVNYGTEMNSSKAISLLHYLSWVLTRGEKGHGD